MSLTPRALALLTALTLGSGLLFALLMGGVRPGSADGQAVPSVTSDNVEQLATLPGTVAISGVFSRTAP